MRLATSARLRNGTWHRLGELQGGLASHQAGGNFFPNPIRLFADESGMKIYNTFMGGSSGPALDHAAEKRQER